MPVTPLSYSTLPLDLLKPTKRILYPREQRTKRGQKGQPGVPLPHPSLPFPSKARAEIHAPHRRTNNCTKVRGTGTETTPPCPSTRRYTTDYGPTLPLPPSTKASPPSAPSLRTPSCNILGHPTAPRFVSSLSLPFPSLFFPTSHPIPFKAWPSPNDLPPAASYILSFFRDAHIAGLFSMPSQHLFSPPLVTLLHPTDRASRRIYIRTIDPSRYRLVVSTPILALPLHRCASRTQGPGCPSNL